MIDADGMPFRMASGSRWPSARRAAGHAKVAASVARPPRINIAAFTAALLAVFASLVARSDEAAALPISQACPWRVEILAPTALKSPTFASRGIVVTSDRSVLLRVDGPAPGRWSLSANLLGTDHAILTPKMSATDDDAYERVDVSRWFTRITLTVGKRTCPLEFVALPIAAVAPTNAPTPGASTSPQIPQAPPQVVAFGVGGQPWGPVALGALQLSKIARLTDSYAAFDGKIMHVVGHVVFGQHVQTSGLVDLSTADTDPGLYATPPAGDSYAMRLDLPPDAERGILPQIAFTGFGLDGAAGAPRLALNGPHMLLPHSRFAKGYKPSSCDAGSAPHGAFYWTTVNGQTDVPLILPSSPTGALSGTMTTAAGKQRISWCSDADLDMRIGTPTAHALSASADEIDVALDDGGSTAFTYVSLKNAAYPITLNSRTCFSKLTGFHFAPYKADIRPYGEFEYAIAAAGAPTPTPPPSSAANSTPTCALAVTGLPFNGTVAVKARYLLPDEQTGSGNVAMKFDVVMSVIRPTPSPTAMTQPKSADSATASGGANETPQPPALLVKDLKVDGVTATARDENLPDASTWSYDFSGAQIDVSPSIGTSGGLPGSKPLIFGHQVENCSPDDRNVTVAKQLVSKPTMRLCAGIHIQAGSGAADSDIAVAVLGMTPMTYVDGVTGSTTSAFAVQDFGLQERPTPSPSPTATGTTAGPATAASTKTTASAAPSPTPAAHTLPRLRLGSGYLELTNVWAVFIDEPGHQSANSFDSAAGHEVAQRFGCDDFAIEGHLTVNAVNLPIPNNEALLGETAGLSPIFGIGEKCSYLVVTGPLPLSFSEKSDLLLTRVVLAESTRHNVSGSGAPALYAHAGGALTSGNVTAFFSDIGFRTLTEEERLGTATPFPGQRCFSNKMYHEIQVGGGCVVTDVDLKLSAAITAAQNSHQILDFLQQSASAVASFFLGRGSK